MELHKTSAHALYAHLSKEELSRHRLTFADLQKESSRTKRLIRCILSAAQTTLGFSLPPNGALRIDALEHTDGGLALLLTAKEKTPRQTAGVRTLVCRSDNEADLLALFARLQHPPFHKLHCTLYRLHTGYCLQLRFTSPQQAAQARAFLAEYCTVEAGKAPLLAYLAEYGQPLICKAI